MDFKILCINYASKNGGEIQQNIKSRSNHLPPQTHQKSSAEFENHSTNQTKIKRPKVTWFSWPFPFLKTIHFWWASFGKCWVARNFPIKLKPIWQPLSTRFLVNPHLDQEPGCKHLPDLLDLGAFPKVGTYVSMDVVPQATDFQKVLHTIGISLRIFLRVFQDGFRV